MDDVTLRDKSNNILSYQDLICFDPTICFEEKISDVFARFKKKNDLLGKNINMQYGMYLYNHDRFQHMSLARISVHIAGADARTWFVNERDHREYLDWKCDNS